MSPRNESMHNLNTVEGEQAELTSHRDYNLSTQNVGISLFLPQCGFQNCEIPQLHGQVHFYGGLF